MVVVVVNGGAPIVLLYGQRAFRIYPSLVRNQLELCSI